MMNDTNISNWTVDSSHERSFMTPSSYLAPNQLILSPSKPPKSPQKTHTHRPSTSYHSNLSQLYNNHNNESKQLELNNTDNTNNATIDNNNETNIQIKNTKNTNLLSTNIEHNTQNTLQISNTQPQNQNIDTISTEANSSNSLIDKQSKNISDEGTPTLIHDNNNNNINVSVSSYTETYIHPLDRDNNKKMSINIQIDDRKDEEIYDITSMISSDGITSVNTCDTKDNNLLRNSLNHTIDYTKKLMATIQSMEEDNNLKYKLRKYAMKIKKLERELSDERKINENKSIFLDKVNNELNKTNIEIERMESEKRCLKMQLKQLEDIQQKYRLLEMKNLQLMQSNKIKDLEIDKVNKDLFVQKDKLQRTLEDRDNISAVSEVLREELTNKKASIQRYKDINKKLNDKLSSERRGNINNLSMDNRNNNKLSDTLYTIPDATKLYVRMNDFEESVNKCNKNLQEKYSNQSREFMQLKLENQSIKNINNGLKKDIMSFSEKLKNTIEEKSKFLEDIRTTKLAHKLDIKQLKRELVSKNSDIERLKRAMWNINKFITNQTHENVSVNNGENVMGNSKGKHNELNEGEKRMNYNMNVTSLSFDHDLDLEITDNMKVELDSTKSKVIYKRKKSRKDRDKNKSLRSGTDSLVSSGRDLLDDITKIITNQKRSSKNKIKNIKNVKRSNGKNIKRQFIPSAKNNNSIGSLRSRARRIALKKKNGGDKENKNSVSTVKLASV